MLAVVYGPDWRVPDPSFQHQPGPGGHRPVRRLVRLADAQPARLGALPRRPRRRRRTHGPSDFAAWVADRLVARNAVDRGGLGTGADALAVAERGFEVLGLDYSRQGQLRADSRRETARLSGVVQPLNLYDLRDVLTRGALAGPTSPAGRRAVYARGLLEAPRPRRAQENFWRFTRMVLRGGGRAYVEGESLVARRLRRVAQRARRGPAAPGGPPRGRGAGRPARWPRRPPGRLPRARIGRARGRSGAGGG